MRPGRIRQQPLVDSRQKTFAEVSGECSASDQLVFKELDEFDSLVQRLEKVIDAIKELYGQWPQAQRLDAIKGIGVVSAVSIMARIGSIERFPTADHLIGYAGLNPGVRQSNATRRDGHLGGGGTDQQLRPT